MAATPNEAPSPEELAEDEEEMTRFKEWWRDACAAEGDWVKEAEKMFDMVAGHQWSSEDESILKERLQPATVFNRLGVIVNTVCGLEQVNRQETVYIPRQVGKAGKNELLTAAGKYFRDQSRAEKEESDAFRDMVICGMGWVDDRIDYEIEPDGKPVSERVDPLEMRWDPASKKHNLTDRKFQFRAKSMPLEAAQGMFPEVEEASDLDASWASLDLPGAKAEPHQATEAKLYKNDQSGKDKNRAQNVTILECQWWEKESYWRIADPASDEIKSYDLETGQSLIDKAQMLADAGQGQPLATRLADRRVYMRAFIGGRVLKKGPAPFPKGFSCNPMTGYRDRKKNTWYGIVRDACGPQEIGNKTISTLIHQLATSGKGVIVDKTKVDNVRKFEENYAKPGPVYVNGSPEGVAMPKPSGEISPVYEQLLQFAITGTRDSTGVNVEALGLANRDQPGVLERERKQAAITILASFFDSLRQFRIASGKVVLYFIIEYFSDGRLIKIDGEQGAQYVKLIRSDDTAEYDVEVDEATTSPNQKEQVWDLLQQLLPELKGMLPPSMIADVLPFTPLPTSLVTKWVAEISKQAQKGPPPPPPDMVAKVERDKSATEKNRADAIAALVKAGIVAQGPKLDMLQSAIDALLESAQSGQDHQQTMQQADQDHSHQVRQTVAGALADGAQQPPPGMPAQPAPTGPVGP